MEIEKVVHAMAVCLDCGWSTVRRPVDDDPRRVSWQARNHCNERGHTVDVVRTEFRTYMPDD